ncbi:hypothetical protein U1Q18_018445 [Sarracenia purpurea var. burkii]
MWHSLYDEMEKRKDHCHWPGCRRYVAKQCLALKPSATPEQLQEMTKSISRTEAAIWGYKVSELVTFSREETKKDGLSGSNIRRISKFKLPRKYRKSLLLLVLTLNPDNPKGLTTSAPTSCYWRLVKLSPRPSPCHAFSSATWMQATHHCPERTKEVYFFALGAILVVADLMAEGILQDFGDPTTIFTIMEDFSSRGVNISCYYLLLK